MLQTRVIPVLLLRNKGLVKTVRFDKSKYIGDPINAVKLFNDKEVDELVFLDIDAAKAKRKPDFALIKNIASECFMPLGYGGGITEFDDIAALFAIGVEKVIINSASLENLDLISKASAVFGDQSIVVSVDIKKNIWGKHQIYDHTGIKHHRLDLMEYIKNAQQAGAGELIINAVDCDGMMQGYDLELIQKVSSSTLIPVVACGGAGSLADLKKAVNAGASGVAAGSLFIYHGPHKAVLINYPSQKKLKQLFA